MSLKPNSNVLINAEKTDSTLASSGGRKNSNQVKLAAITMPCELRITKPKPQGPRSRTATSQFTVIKPAGGAFQTRLIRFAEPILGVRVGD
ncbi:hypothetical protein JCGZ_12932 [Jatropha curcas]|uniref:Uncharacterized protein n=1 Tax=Jatropha curcas TaxID=180498 RepID=A0A067LPJ5_JATCU|nr:hypothetical protein JCGZ_12932 [Jatropha curcas]